jgi:hypothetical protein
MRGPSVVALTLDEARSVLRDAGVEVLTVTETAPPARRLAGPLRVLRERWQGEGVHLLVAASVGRPRGEGGRG